MLYLHISSVLPFLPGLGPKRYKGVPIIVVAILEIQQEEHESIFKAEQLTMMWDQATVTALHGFDCILHSSQQANFMDFL